VHATCSTHLAILDLIEDDLSAIPSYEFAEKSHLWPILGRFAAFQRFVHVVRHELPRSAPGGFTGDRVS
jgi:hypothetical protein